MQINTTLSDIQVFKVSLLTEYGERISRVPHILVGETNKYKRDELKLISYTRFIYSGYGSSQEFESEF